MIPYELTEFYDPGPDYELIDAAYDARREEEERARYGFADYQVSVGAGERGRHRATGDESEGRLW